jgi:acetylornithine deacetylase/succinyl-diaminopimelate desuccinylase-like protein
MERNLKILEDFLKIPTISAQNKGLKEARDFLTSILRELNFEVRVFPKEEVIFASTRDNSSQSKKTLLFYNHYDVQPPEPLSQWQSEPFQPVVKDGRIIARGVADNKGDLIVRLLAVKELLQEAQGKLPCKVKFILDGQEEIGSPNLEKFARAHPKLLEADGCIWEGGSRTSEGRLTLELGYKGILSVELVVKTAKNEMHSSYGGIAPNAAWRLTSALSSLRDTRGRILIKGFYDNVKKRDKEAKELLKKLPTSWRVELKEAGVRKSFFPSSNTQSKKRLYFSPEINIDGITSGYQGKGHKTILPPEAQAKIDFRLVPNQKPEEILRKLKVHFKKKGFNELKILSRSGYPAGQTSPKHPYVKLISRVVKEVSGKEPILYPNSPGSSPQYLFSSRMPCVGIGIGHPKARVHGANENVLLKDLIQGVRIIKEIITAFK